MAISVSRHDGSVASLLRFSSHHCTSNVVGRLTSVYSVEMLVRFSSTLLYVYLVSGTTSAVYNMDAKRLYCFDAVLYKYKY